QVPGHHLRCSGPLTAPRGRADRKGESNSDRRPFCPASAPLTPGTGSRRRAQGRSQGAPHPPMDRVKKETTKQAARILMHRRARLRQRPRQGTRGGRRKRRWRRVSLSSSQELNVALSQLVTNGKRVVVS